jgi:hypothetical protein
MQQFSAAQLALIANGALLQDNTLPWRVLQAASVHAALDLRYRRLAALIGVADLDMAAIETALDEIYRRLGVLIGVADLDMASLETELDGLYRRLDKLIHWSDLDEESVFEALDARYGAGRNYTLRNWSSTVTGTSVELPAVPMEWHEPQVFVNGLLNGPAHYTIVGNLLTFTSPLSGDDVQVIFAEEVTA